jgi:PRC-barrel domain
MRRTLVALVFMITATSAASRAQTPGKLDLEAAELTAELIGGLVFSADGREIGELSDVSIADDGRVTKIRITTSAALGLGPRTLEIPEGAFTLLRGAVVLDLPAEAIESLPSPPPEHNAEDK